MGARHPAALRLRQGAHASCSRTTARRLVLWAPETVGLPALSEVLRLYDVDTFERESASHARRPHRRGLCRRRVERRGRHRRGRERGRPVAHDAGAAGDRGPARGEQRRADHPHAERAADAGGQGRRERHPHRAVRALELGALSRRRHAARGRAAEPRPACGADLAPEDHGRARHRRAPPAAGRPHLAAHRRPRRRRPRLDAAVGARRARRAAPARQGRVEVHARRPRHERRDAGEVRPPDQAAARHHPRHRADRLGQDDDALRLARPRRHRRHQHPHRRGPGRVRARRHRPDAGQRQDRPHLRRRRCARSCARTPTSS